ncbi:MAG: hypothetical protein ACRYHQ_09090 [Janthinobacterium lividum]
MAGIWDELGIAPTTDAAAIRRAYAARLKIVRPDADPQGFAHLREAYERCLSTAKSAASPPPNVALERVAPVPAPFPVVPPAQRPSPDPMVELLRQGNVLAAVEWLAAARAAGTLALAADLRVADRLGWVMAEDRTLPAEAVREAARRLGWPENAIAAGWASTLRTRLDAERWLETLRRDAASRKRWLGAALPIVARMLLGRGRLGFSQIMAGDPRLKRLYGEYLLHASVVGDQFDAVRTEAIGRLLTRRPHPQVERVFETFALLAIACTVGALAGELAAELDPRLQNGVTGAVAVILLLVLMVPTIRRRLHRALSFYGRR